MSIHKPPFDAPPAYYSGPPPPNGTSPSYNQNNNPYYGSPQPSNANANANSDNAYHTAPVPAAPTSTVLHVKDDPSASKRLIVGDNSPSRIGLYSVVYHCAAYFSSRKNDIELTRVGQDTKCATIDYGVFDSIKLNLLQSNQPKINIVRDGALTARHAFDYGGKRWVWKHTHAGDAKMGSWKLEEGGRKGEIVALHKITGLWKGMKTGERGTLEIFGTTEKRGGDWEMVVLMTALALVEKDKREAVVAAAV